MPYVVSGYWTPNGYAVGDDSLVGARACMTIGAPSAAISIDAPRSTITIAAPSSPVTITPLEC